MTGGATCGAPAPLPSEIRDLKSLDDVLGRAGATAISFGGDELFDLPDRLLRIDDETILIFRYDDLRRIGPQNVASNVPSDYSQPRFLFEPLGLDHDDPRFEQVRRLSRNSVFSARPDVHDLMKPIISRPLMPKAMPPFAVVVEDIAESLIARFAGTGEIEFAEEFAQALAFELWVRVLNMNTAESAAIKNAMKGMAPIVMPGGPVSVETLTTLNGAIEEYLGALVAALQRARANGSTAFVLAMAEQFASISDPPPRMPESLEAMVATSLLDGFHALGASFASCVYALLSNPEVYRAVCGDPSLADVAVAEGLRLYAPVRIVSRYAIADFEFDGLRITAGTLLAMHWGAGGRDPTVYANPRAFDLARPDRAVATFGAGRQICPGRNVVRTLCTVGLRTLARAKVSAELTGEVDWHIGAPLTYNTQLTRMPVKLVTQ